MGNGVINWSIPPFELVVFFHQLEFEQYTRFSLPVNTVYPWKKNKEPFECREESINFVSFFCSLIDEMRWDGPPAALFGD